MLGAITGDIAASVYERRKYTGGDWDAPLFPAGSRFTDDTVMTVACFQAVKDIDAGAVPANAFRSRFQEYGRRYPDAGFGQQFRKWIENPVPYNSWGNGAAMRVSPIGWMRDDLRDVIELAEQSALVSHDHPEGIRAARTVAAGVFLSRKGASKDEIRQKLEELSGYDLSRKLADIRPSYRWSSWSQRSVPEAIIMFLESHDFESAIRAAIWLGGDADTQGAIAGSLAEAFYGDVPESLLSQALSRLDTPLSNAVSKWRRNR